MPSKPVGKVVGCAAYDAHQFGTLCIHHRRAHLLLLLLLLLL